MKSKLPPATSFIPRPEAPVQITPRIPSELKAEMESAAKALGITLQDLVIASARRYLAELRAEGAIQ